MGGSLYLDSSIATITPHQLFVCRNGTRPIIKLDKLSGDIISSVKLEDPISSITADTGTLYVGMYDTNQILHLSLEDMSTIKVTSLNSSYIYVKTLDNVIYK